MDCVFTFSVISLLLLCSNGFTCAIRSDVPQEKLLTNSEKSHREDTKLSRHKRSIYINPLLVYMCSLPVGLGNGQVPDAAFSASSSVSNKHGPARARLNIHADGTGYGAWSVGTNDVNQWLQVDFGELVRVTKVGTQGRQDSDEWVKQFSLSYSIDGIHWAEYKENSVKLVFLGNKDRNTVVEQLLVTPFNAQFVRFHPKSWHGHISMRAEVYGCRNVHTCSISLGVEDGRIPDSALTASGSLDNNHRPSLARLNLLNKGSEVGAWCPRPKSANEWLQIDLGDITAVTKVATQGRYNSDDRVTTYKLSYSVYGSYWTFYKHRGVDKVFAGNSDRNTILVHSLKPHVEARFIRIHPITHNLNNTCLRAELYGCRSVKNCLMPVGVENGRIPDEAFSASSSANSNYGPSRARLNLLPSGGKYCWAAAQNNANQWLQVKLGRTFIVRGVATQGRHDGDQWVKSFSLSYSTDDINWVFVKENSQVKTFLGNVDRTTVVKHFFSPEHGLFARSIRFHPKAFQGHMSMRVEIYGCEDVRSCLTPLGMESGHLPDSALTASSSATSANHIPPFSRLNKKPASGKAGAWCAGTNDANQWLQVYFGRETTVTKVAIQGRYDASQWVTRFILSYSVDGTHWAYYRLSDGKIKGFGGNIDRNTPVYHSLDSPIQAKYLRFNPKSWTSHISMRAEVYGCQEGFYCSMSLGLEDGRIPDAAMTASSIASSNHAANLARLNLVAKSGKVGGWSAKANDNNQWLKIDLGALTTITKIATQGRQDHSSWVKSYTLFYSLSGSYWVKYTLNGRGKVFRGNFDRDSIVVHHIFPPIHARFVRIHPSTWYSHISMRAELYGCLIRGTSG